MYYKESKLKQVERLLFMFRDVIRYNSKYLPQICILFNFISFLIFSSYVKHNTINTFIENIDTINKHHWDYSLLCLIALFSCSNKGWSRYSWLSYGLMVLNWNINSIYLMCSWTPDFYYLLISIGLMITFVSIIVYWLINH